MAGMEYQAPALRCVQGREESLVWIGLDRIGLVGLRYGERAMM